MLSLPRLRIGELCQISVGRHTVSDELKKRAAEKAIEFIRTGDVVGLGTGSTAAHAIAGLGQLILQGFNIRGVPTSRASERLAREHGIPTVALNDVERIDITIDGADQVDTRLDMIKGGGGALTWEKLVAISSQRRVYVVDQSKLVYMLGGTFALPVEVLPVAWRLSARLLAELGCEAQLRVSGADPFETDNGNFIVDCKFESIPNPVDLERAIKQVPGVVESGLFVGLADLVVIGFDDGVQVRERIASKTAL
jgi:ribose 5-phosphate isomerase A